jgi:hypothetical protein
MKIKNPLTGNDEPIPAVLQSLAGQEGCDGEPYDQMVAAADYIKWLEKLLREAARIMPPSIVSSRTTNAWRLEASLALGTVDD